METNIKNFVPELSQLISKYELAYSPEEHVKLLQSLVTLIFYSETYDLKE